jgi:hypothetical protein
MLRFPLNHLWNLEPSSVNIPQSISVENKAWQGTRKTFSCKFWLPILLPADISCRGVSEYLLGVCALSHSQISECRGLRPKANIADGGYISKGVKFSDFKFLFDIYGLGRSRNIPSSA